MISIRLFLILGLIGFWIGVYEESHAVTFNGGTTVSFPSFSTGAGNLYGYNFSIPGDQYGAVVYGKYNGGLAMGEFERSIVLVYGSGTSQSQSGIYWHATFNKPGDSSDKVIERVEKFDDGTWRFTIHNEDVSLGINQYIGGVTQDQKNGCPGGNGQCVLVLNPVYTIVQTGIDSGVYIKKLGAFFFTDSAGNVKHKDYIFTGTTYGFKINDGWNQWIWNNESLSYFDNSNGRYSNIYWKSVASYDDVLSYDRFMTGGNVGAITTLKDWLGASGVIEGGQDVFTGTTNTGTTTNFTEGWYDNCTGFTDIFCYVESTINGIGNYFFPNISFTGEFQSCNFQVESVTGSYLQKFANIIAVVNPYPPSSGATLCMLYSSGVMSYQRLIPEENFFKHYVPGALPEVEDIETKIFGQSIFDIITIFAMIILIFYKRH